MFEESLLESTALLRTRNRWPAIVSLSMQTLLAAALIALPLLHPEILPLRLLPMLRLAPPPPLPPAPPPPRVHLGPAASAPASPPAAPLTAQPRIATLHPTVLADAPIASTLNLNASGDGPLSSLANAVASGAGPSPRIVPTPAAPKATGLARISRGVSAGLLLFPIRPDYPSIARAARIQGTVVVQAIISATGHIEAAHAVSGPLMLQAAALTAVRDARYRPFLLNGQPTEVETTITITFRLDS